MKIVKVEKVNITGLGNAKRTIIRYEDGSADSIPARLFRKYRFAEGDDVDALEREALRKEIFSFEWSYLLHFLEKAPKSSQEIRKRLSGRGDALEMIDRLIALAFEEHIISDDDTKEVLVRSYFGKGFGPSYIKMKIAEKGLKYEKNDLEGYDFVASCAEEYRKYVKTHGHLPAKKIRIAALNYLTRRGFPFEVIKRALGDEDE